MTFEKMQVQSWVPENDEIILRHFFKASSPKWFFFSGSGLTASAGMAGPLFA